MFSISNQELYSAPKIKSGEMIPWACKHKKHKVRDSDSKPANKECSVRIQYVVCGKHTYLAGINSHKV